MPASLIDICYRASRRLFNWFSSPAQKRAEERKKTESSKIRDASDFVELCRLYGYTAEEHVFQTKDGYLLGLHRLAWRPGEEDLRVNAGPRSLHKRVVYMHHGLLMNSEVWVCTTEARRCLPLVLVDRGFDVWFGNNRGNKYSKKSVHAASTSAEFWNFSIDEFALHDIPDSIAYVLEATGQPSLSYIGFSQGTAQAFASLAIHPRLNDQINVFIALAPAMSPAGLSNGIVDALVKASPQVVYLLFGRRCILSSATLWQSILYPPIFVRAIDIGLAFLFGWRTANITLSQKLAAYAHLYSYTSTKSVVHWFQIMRTKSFQMYDDEMHAPLLALSSASSRHTKVTRYPTRNIKTPVVLVYGGSDSLVDIDAMLRELPSQTVATEVPHYEHLDFLWAHDVEEQVFPHVFDALNSFPRSEHTKEDYARYRSARHQSLSVSSTLRRSQYNLQRDGDGEGDKVDKADKVEGAEPEGLMAVQDTAASLALDPTNPHSDDETVEDGGSCSRPASPPAGRPGTAGTDEVETRSVNGSLRSVTGSQRSTVPRPTSQKKTSSGLSFDIDSIRGGRRGGIGIRLGSSKAVGGLTTEAAIAPVAASPPLDGEGRGRGRTAKRNFS